MIYGLDRLLRVLKSRVCEAQFEVLSDSMTRVEIPHLNRGWFPTQYVFIQVPSSAMGWLGWMRGRPLTIASTPAKEGDGLVLICGKKEWPELYEFATQKSLEMTAKSRVATVVVEGPYGK